MGESLCESELLRRCLRLFCNNWLLFCEINGSSKKTGSLRDKSHPPRLLLHHGEGEGEGEERTILYKDSVHLRPGKPMLACGEIMRF